MANVRLFGADFTDAVHVPEEIAMSLDSNGIFTGTKSVTLTETGNPVKTVFFSMPGVLSKGEELLVREVKNILENGGYKVQYYVRDQYPEFGQFNRVRESIHQACGVIAFGFKHLNVQKGLLYPNTSNQCAVEDVWYSTPWIEIEVGMAIMKGLPILMFKDSAINNGVFDEKLNEFFVGHIDVDKLDARDIERNSEFVNWMKQLN